MLNNFLNKPNYNLSPKILAAIAKIERAQGIIDASPLVPTFERDLQYEAMLATIHASTHIEGNVLGQGAVERILKGEIVTARQRDIQEVVNYRNVIEYVGKVFRNTKQPFTDVMIREFHRVLMRDLLPEEQLGQYRIVQNYIVDARTGKTIYTPPPARDVPKLMLALTDWIVGQSPGSCHPVIKAALAHFLVEAVHPFVDGNGRVGRVVAMFLLYRDGYDTRRLFSLEDYYDQDPKQYYQSLRSVLTARADATEWVEYFVTGFAVQIDQISQKIRAYLDGEKNRDKFVKQELNKRQFDAVRWLQHHKSVTALEYAEHFKVSKRTANYDLSELVGKKMVLQEGESRSSRFKLA
ncbi:MAG: Fic family protein [Patescibacteria group bacterium]|jgi:Fic family protein